MLEVYAIKVPIEYKEKVLKVTQRVELNKHSADIKDIKFLFKIYLEYLAPHDKQDIYCRACRSKVCGIFFSIVRTWNKQN